MRLKNRIAIITGAGRGIGKAIALRFAREGADIVAVSRTLSEITETAEEIKEMGPCSLAIRADISSREEVEEMVDRVVREFGKVDILVNNAGVQGPIGPVVENNVDQWIKTININLIGTFLCIRAILPIMIRFRKGKIINLSGGGATSARPYFSAYSASKAAVVRLTETIAEEVKGFNIQVNAIAPGSVNTRMLEETIAAGRAAGEKELNKVRCQREEGGIPPELAASLALFLASDDSDGLTGRLISAVWDDWKGMKERIPEIMGSDIYTLRRIVK